MARRYCKMSVENAKLKTFKILICAIVLSCFFCAFFSPLMHDCLGARCELCVAAEICRVIFGAIIFCSALFLCVDLALSTRLFDDFAAFCKKSTPVRLKVKLSD